MRLTRSARKHGIAADDIRRVLAAPLRTVMQGDVELHIGLTAGRDLIEVVVTPGDPVIVLHAMRLRPANYRFLRWSGETDPGETA
ncbi:MAG TPA: hypothetical protein VGN22_09620 [Pseudonocardia sp.]